MKSKLDPKIIELAKDKYVNRDDSFSWSGMAREIIKELPKLTYGISPDTLRKRIARSLDHIRSDSLNQSEMMLEEIKVRKHGNTTDIQATFKKPKTLEDICKECDIDLEEWDIVHYNPKSHQGYIKNKDEEIETVDLYHYNLKLKPRVAITSKNFDKMFAEWGEKSPVVKKRKYKKRKEKLSMEIDIFDAHIDKLCREHHTGEAHTLEIATDRRFEGFYGLLGRVNLSSISEFVFPIGNDMLNSDNLNHTTTKGTQMFNSVHFHDAYRGCVEILIKSIDILAEYGHVHVPVIPGNHDKVAMFTIGVALELYYRNNKNVTIENSSKDRKYYQFGKNLVGFVHGENEKPASLPMILMTECKDLLHTVKFMEMRLGHIHHSKTLKPVMTESSFGVEVNYIQNPAPEDKYESSRGWVGGRKRVQGVVRDAEYGKVQELFYNF